MCDVSIGRLKLKGFLSYMVVEAHNMKMKVNYSVDCGKTQKTFFISFSYANDGKNEATCHPY